MPVRKNESFRLFRLYFLHAPERKLAKGRQVQFSEAAREAGFPRTPDRTRVREKAHFTASSPYVRSACRVHKKGAQTGDETLSGSQVGSTLAAAIEDVLRFVT